MVLTRCEHRLASFGFTSMAVAVKVDSENKKTANDDENNMC